MKKITEGELADLLRDRYQLRCLLAHGVDTWEFYNKSLDEGVLGEGSYYEFASQPINDMTYAYDTL